MDFLPGEERKEGVSEIKPLGSMSKGYANAGSLGRAVNRHEDIWCIDPSGENKEIGQQQNAALSILSIQRSIGKYW